MKPKEVTEYYGYVLAYSSQGGLPRFASAVVSRDGLREHHTIKCYSLYQGLSNAILKNFLLHLILCKWYSMDLQSLLICVVIASRILITMNSVLSP